MKNPIAELKKIVPEAITLFIKRYRLLQEVMNKQPIGRRGLMQLLECSERTIRNEVDKLEREGLVEVGSLGICITPTGEEVLSTLYALAHSLEASNRLEDDIKKLLNLKAVFIVAGDLDQDEKVKEQFGYACASLMEELLKDGMTLAITGGTTIAKMVEHMPRLSHSYQHVQVIPARGSIGYKVELQAHTISAALAQKLGAKYELLAVPDNLSHQSLNLIKSEPQIQKLLQKIEKTDMIIFGIGNALKMAKNRKESATVLEILEKRHAVAEAFRHYFNAQGEVVYASESIGVGPKEARRIPVRIAAAGGKSKAEAILASSELLKDSYLILDEAAAKKMMELCHKV